jgi:HTH-type transcriptional regulator/antitoxin HipB
MSTMIKTMAQLQSLLPALRKNKGLTQTMLAERLGMSQQSYARIEGNPASTSVERLLWILNALETDLVLCERDLARTSGRAAIPNDEVW